MKNEFSYKNFTSFENREYEILLNETKELFNEILEYGFYLMKIILEDSEIEKKPLEIVSFSILKEALELTDGINIMISNSCFQSSTPVVRSLFELLIYVKYIFLDFDKIEEKLTLYQIQDLERQIFYYNKFLKKESITEEEKKYYLQMKNDLEIKVTTPKYLKYHKFYQKNKKYVGSWYKYYSDNETLKSLAKKVGMLKFYETIYDILSNKAHGNASLKGIEYENKSLNIPQFRLPKSIANIDMSLTYITAIFKIIIKYHLKEEDTKNYRDWHIEYLSKRKELLECWKNIEIE